MLFWFGKVGQFFVKPLSVSIILLCLGLWKLRTGRSRAAKWLIASSLGVLVFFSLPVVSHLLIGSLEKYASLPEEIPTADSIVILGGTIPPLISPRRYPEEIWGSRVVMGARLYRIGKSKHLIVSGGVPYKDEKDSLRNESMDMKLLLTDLGVPDPAIQTENLSRNTYENAVESAKILRQNNQKKILLVTSAFHMKRSQKLFERQGLEVIPIPTSFEGVGLPWKWSYLVPASDALEQSTRAIKEYLALTAYLFL